MFNNNPPELVSELQQLLIDNIKRIDAIHVFNSNMAMRYKVTEDYRNTEKTSVDKYGWLVIGDSQWRLTGIYQFRYKYGVLTIDCCA